MKGSLIDMEAWDRGEGYCAMCAQGQVLSLYAGWTPERLHETDQSEADAATAEALNISRAHAILLRNINDSAAGAPSIVLTDPQKVLGDKWSKLLDFWWMFHRYEAEEWRAVAAAGPAAWDAREAARDAARAAGNADDAGDAAGAAASDAWAARNATWEIQGFELLGARGRDVFFLPMFGINTLDDIPARPAGYGNGVVPVGAA